jgi:hypothetical protein
MAPPSTSALWADAEDLAGPRLPSARHSSMAERGEGEAPAPVGVSSKLWSYEIAGDSTE